MPSNTNNMVWDYDLHFYKLTPDGVKNRLNANVVEKIGSTTEVEVFLQEQSINVRTWLYGYVRKEAVRLTEYRIANDYEGTLYGGNWREAIEDALITQVSYAIRFDGDLEAQRNGDFNSLVSVVSKRILISNNIATKKIPSVRVPEGDYREDY